MKVRDETAETPCETDARELGGREASLIRMSIDRAASPSAWTCRTDGQACRSGVPAVGVEAFMDNAGLYRLLHAGTEEEPLPCDA